MGRIYLIVELQINKQQPLKEPKEHPIKQHTPLILNKILGNTTPAMFLISTPKPTYTGINKKIKYTKNAIKNLTAKEDCFGVFGLPTAHS